MLISQDDTEGYSPDEEPRVNISGWPLKKKLLEVKPDVERPPTCIKGVPTKKSCKL